LRERLGNLGRRAPRRSWKTAFFAAAPSAWIVADGALPPSPRAATAGEKGMPPKFRFKLSNDPVTLLIT
jgi:hypothetical protein